MPPNSIRKRSIDYRSINAILRYGLNGPRGFAVAIIFLVIGGFLLSSCHRLQPPEKVRIMVAGLGLSAPLYVALDRGYFRDEGLDVSLQQTVTGTEALQAVLDGKGDMATCTETPIMRAVTEGRMIYILATIGDSETMDAILARQDRGISRPEDLEGKVIGVPPLTNMEYFLDTFLLDHNVSREKTRIVYLKTEELGPALIAGKVDAVCIWEPHLTKLQGQLGGEGRAFYGLGTYRLTWQVSSVQDFVKKHPETVKKVLRALIKARNFIIEHPDQALEITANHVHIDKSALAAPWKGYNFKVTLSQSVLVSLQDQARWANRRKGLSDKTIPNFLDVFYLEGLKSVDPTLVTVGD